MRCSVEVSTHVCVQCVSFQLSVFLCPCFTPSLCRQIEVETVDRTGTFIGSLWENRVNVGALLLQVRAWLCACMLLCLRDSVRA